MAIGIGSVRPISGVGVRGFGPVGFFMRTKTRFFVYSFAFSAKNDYTLPMTINVPLVFNMQYHKDIMYRTYFETSTDETLISFDAKLQKHAKSGTDTDGNWEYPTEMWWDDTGWTDIGANTVPATLNGSVKLTEIVQEYNTMANVEFARLVITINASSSWTSAPTLNVEGWANTWSMSNVGGRAGSIESGKKPTYENTSLRRDLSTLRDY